MQVCTPATRREADRRAQAHHGAPGPDGVTVEAIEAAGGEAVLAQRCEEWVRGTYPPTGSRRRSMAKAEGRGERQGSIGASRARVGQGALTLIREPIVEADFQDGSCGDRPGRSAHDAVERVAHAIVRHQTRGLALDLPGDDDPSRHDVRWSKVAKRVREADVRRVLTWLRKATGKRGIAQGEVIAPLLSPVDLPKVDRMRERAKAGTRVGKDTSIAYARLADDLVIVVEAYPQPDGRVGAGRRRLREEWATLHGGLKETQSRVVDLRKGETFGFLGVDFRRGRARSGNWRAQ